MKRIITHFSVPNRIINVKKVNLVYNIHEIEHIEKEINNSIDKKKHVLALNDLNFSDSKIKALDEEIE